MLFLVDDMREGELQWMPITREILGAGGMRFKDAISSHPICCPARAQLLTGQLGTNNGVHHNVGANGGYQAFDPSNSIATMVDAAGYHTAFHGKYLNRYGPNAGPTEPGWDKWDALTGGVYDYFDFTFANGDSFTDDYVSTRIERRTIRSIEEAGQAGDPFFVVSSHLAPHNAFGPSWPDGRYNAPPAEDEFADDYESEVAPSVRAASFGETDKQDMPFRYGLVRDTATREAQDRFLARIRALQSVDRAVGRTVAELRNRGIYDDTYVFFASDNGYMLGEHSLHKKNWLYRESLRIPLLVTGPGIQPGTTTDVPATLADVAITIARIAAAESTLTFDGANLLRILRGERTQIRRDTNLLLSAYRRRWAFIGVRTDRYTYGMWKARPGADFLFDRRRDPDEMTNVADNRKYREIRSRLRGRSTRLFACRGYQECNVRFGALPAPTSGTIRQRARVLRVIDGDTVRVRLSNGRRRSVRMIGIKAPNRDRCGYWKSKGSLKRVLPRGRRVRLVSDPTQPRRDRYGRPLRYVKKSTRDTGRLQVARGVARAIVSRKRFKKVRAYRHSQRVARANRRGLWRSCWS